jgi:hypothetical protein
MQIEIQAQHNRNFERWRELQADRELARLPHRIETDRFGSNHNERVARVKPQPSPEQNLSITHLSFCPLAKP